MNLSNFNPQEHFSFLTHRVARLLDQDVNALFKDLNLDLPPSCLGILAELWKKDGVSQHELEISLIKNKSSINKMLGSLEEAMLITKTENPNDKRKNLICLTPQGHEIRSHVEKAGFQLEHTFLSKYPDQDIQNAKKILVELYINISSKLVNKN